MVSHELIILLQWLIDHEQESLKKIIARGLQQGLDLELGPVQATEQQQTALNNEELQQHVVDFFALLDTLIYETRNEDEVNTALQRSMIPAIRHIDMHQCDTQSLTVSIEKATQAAENHKGDPKDVLCRELLRRWKPQKKQIVQ
jgi:hypothetical protein